ncbi:MAG: cadherin-like beta sandwich domain-containing protein [Lentimicrobiaceae bacterium]|nr:cadherin-like beta sandwich domain-containing protein [Lentimicrobiaceae bacterium]
MNTKSLLKRLILGLCLFLTFGSFTAKAQHIDTLIFKWETTRSDESPNGVIIYATANELLTVYWGDGSSKSYTMPSGMPNGSKITASHRYADSGIYTVTVVGSPTCQITDFSKNTNYSRFTHIDALKCKSLTHFNVRGNKIDRIEISRADNPNLTNPTTNITCYENRIRLYHCKELYDVTITFGKGQVLARRTLARGDTVDFSADLWFTDPYVYGTTRTIFEVTNKDIAWSIYNYGGTPVAPNTYTEKDGVLAFYKAGNYMIRMWNLSVRSASPNSKNDTAVVYQEIILLPNTDANLASLSVSEGVLVPVFDSTVYSYMVNVPYSISSAIITAVPSDTFASVSGDGLHSLQVGVNTFPVTVTAEDSITTKTYTVVITRAGASANGNLASLTVTSEAGVKPLTPAFIPAVYDYAVNLSYSESYVIVAATPSNPTSSVSGDLGVQLLQVGLNTLSVVVTAEDGTTKEIYTVEITRGGVNVTEAKEEEDAIRIHPNPTTGKLHITCAEALRATSVQIYDAMGSLVETLRAAPVQSAVGKSEMVIDISHLANGIYFLKINGEMYKVAKE